jgi:hypothetical protein
VAQGMCIDVHIGTGHVHHRHRASAPTYLELADYVRKLCSRRGAEALQLDISNAILILAQGHSQRNVT